jgi:hypothetical protein
MLVVKAVIIPVPAIMPVAKAVISPVPAIMPVAKAVISPAAVKATLPEEKEVPTVPVPTAKVTISLVMGKDTPPRVVLKEGPVPVRQAITLMPSTA